MSRKKTLDISLAEIRDARKAEKLNQKNVKQTNERRKIISAVLISFALGAGTGLIFTNVKMQVEDPEKPEIPVFQKIKNDVDKGLNYLMNSKNKNDTNKMEKKIEPVQEYPNKSKIQIEIPTDSDCTPNNTKGCLIS